MGLFNRFFKTHDAKKYDNIVLNPIRQEVDDEDEEDEITAVISAVLASMNDDEEEVVAAIIAAITCMLGTSDFVVRNIKRTYDIDSIWSLRGRMKLMR